MRGTVAVLVVAAIFATPETASATTHTSSAAAVLEMEPSLRWHPEYPRFRTSEYAALSLLLLGNVLSNEIFVGLDTEVWHGGILFDDKFDRWLDGRFSSDVVQNTTRFGDWMLFGLTAWPIGVDSFYTAFLVRRSWDVAIQTALISAQSLALAALLNTLAKRYVTRGRPGVRACAPGETGCPTGAAIHSFYSGHAAAVFNGAGLICVHHQYLGLLGGGWRDDAVCAGALLAATGASLSRLVNRAHFISDVLVGALSGLATGFILPAWLHYDLGRSPMATGPSPHIQAALMPQFGADRVGMALIGRF